MPQPTKPLRKNALGASRKQRVPGQSWTTCPVSTVTHVRGASVGSTKFERSTPRARQLQAIQRVIKLRSVDTYVCDGTGVTRRYEASVQMIGRVPRVTSTMLGPCESGPDDIGGPTLASLGIGETQRHNGGYKS